MYKNYRFLHTDLVSCHFTEFISFNGFLVDYLVFSTYNIILSRNSDSSTSSFSIWKPFILFSCLTVLATAISSMLEKSNKRKHPCLVWISQQSIPIFHHWICYLWSYWHSSPATSCTVSLLIPTKKWQQSNGAAEYLPQTASTAPWSPPAWPGGPAARKPAQKQAKKHYS